VRVTRADAKWLLGAIGNGTSVYLYGGKHVFSAGSGAAGVPGFAGCAIAAPDAPDTKTPARSATVAEPLARYFI